MSHRLLCLSFPIIHIPTVSWYPGPLLWGGGRKCPCGWPEIAAGPAWGCAWAEEGQTPPHSPNSLGLLFTALHPKQQQHPNSVKSGPALGFCMCPRCGYKRAAQGTCPTPPGKCSLCIVKSTPKAPRTAGLGWKSPPAHGDTLSPPWGTFFVGVQSCWGGHGTKVLIFSPAEPQAEPWTSGTSRSGRRRWKASSTSWPTSGRCRPRPSPSECCPPSPPSTPSPAQ